LGFYPVEAVVVGLQEDGGSDDVREVSRGAALAGNGSYAPATRRALRELEPVQARVVDREAAEPRRVEGRDDRGRAPVLARAADGAAGGPGLSLDLHPVERVRVDREAADGVLARGEERRGVGRRGRAVLVRAPDAPGRVDVDGPVHIGRVERQHAEGGRLAAGAGERSDGAAVALGDAGDPVRLVDEVGPGVVDGEGAGIARRGGEDGEGRCRRGRRRVESRACGRRRRRGASVGVFVDAGRGRGQRRRSGSGWLRARGERE
jgi:hypothetical protein